MDVSFLLSCEGRELRCTDQSSKESLHLFS